MSGQVQFDGMVPFLDRNTNQMVQVRVWGAFVGQGIDPHEVQPIQGWIMNALGQSAQSYDGQIQALPSMAQEWGGYVSQQLAPGIASQFQAQGQIQIHGISLDGSAPPAAQAHPAKAAPAKAAPMAAPEKSAAMGGAGMAAAGMAAAGVGMAASAMSGGAMSGGAMSGGVDPNRIQAAAQALSQQMGVPRDQAVQAANIVAQVLSGGAGGAMGAMAGGGYNEKQAKHAAGIEHQNIAAQQKQAQYGKQPQKGQYDKQAQYDKQPQYQKQADPPKYDKQAQYQKQADPPKYDKQAQYQKGQPAPAKHDPNKKYSK
ncbi:MAG: hypothetical protein AB8I08_32255 [Sandaracinaceae bacterium]